MKFSFSFNRRFLSPNQAYLFVQEAASWLLTEDAARLATIEADDSTCYRCLQLFASCIAWVVAWVVASLAPGLVG
jgi:hypothetical protein